MKTLILLAIGATGIGTAVYSGMPPERFQGDKVAVVFFTSDVESLCGTNPPYQILACHKRIKDTSYIVLPNPCPHGRTEYFAKLACHELGHANLWGRNHEP